MAPISGSRVSKAEADLIRATMDAPPPKDLRQPVSDENLVAAEAVKALRLIHYPYPLYNLDFFEILTAYEFMKNAPQEDIDAVMGICETFAEMGIASSEKHASKKQNTFGNILPPGFVQ